MYRPECVADVTVALWEPLATELTLIIGNGGFQSLYARSAHLTSAFFPWMALSHALQQNDTRFLDLKMRLEGRDSSEACEASIALLVTFAGLLDVLIGDYLTSSILSAAWGDSPLDVAIKVVKELNNE